MSNPRVWRASEPNPAKRYLMEYQSLVKRRDALLDELDRLHDANQRATSRLTATRLSGTGGHGSFEDGAIRVVDAEGALNAVILNIDCCLAERLGVIDRVPDMQQRLVLTLRYIKGMSWEDIAKEIFRTESLVFEIHGHALQAIAKVRS